MLSPVLTSVLIPCWNALELTRVCLRQLLKWTDEPFEAVLVDNGSTDGTAEWLAGWRDAALRRAPLLRGVTLVRHPRNLGYAAAMNRALEEAAGELLVFGNADAAVGAPWLAAMRAALDSPSRPAAVSPCCNAPRRLGAPPWACPPHYAGVAGLERFAAAWALRRARANAAPAGGCVPGFWLLARAAEARAAGAFDEAFFPGGYEDWDFQRRLCAGGRRLAFAERAYVHHAWFGCAERNGLSHDDLYTERRMRLFLSRNPGAPPELSLRGPDTSAPTSATWRPSRHAHG